MAFEQQVDKLWNRLKQDINNNVLVSSNWNWPEINSIMCELEIKNTWRREIFKNFVFELKHVKKQPTRNIEWVDGCHAQLYNTYICKDCGCFIHQRDDEEECLDSLFCPVCNPTERFSFAYTINDNSEHYKNMYEHNMFMKEYHRKRAHWFWRRYIEGEITIKHYIWKIKHFFLYNISSSYKKNCDKHIEELFKK